MTAPRFKPTIPEVAPLVRALYRSEWGGAGCCLHIVLDDGNIHDDHVKYCINYAIEQGHGFCRNLGELILRMSRSQRARLNSAK